MSEKDKKIIKDFETDYIPENQTFTITQTKNYFDTPRNNELKSLYKNDLLQVPINEIDNISVKCYNTFKANDFRFLGDLIQYSEENKFTRLGNIGKVGLMNIKEMFNFFGFDLDVYERVKPINEIKHFIPRPKSENISEIEKLENRIIILENIIVDMLKNK